MSTRKTAATAAPKVTAQAGAALPETPCQEAQRLTYGARNEDYGHPVDDFIKTGRMMAPILESLWLPQLLAKMGKTPIEIRDFLRDAAAANVPVPPEAFALSMVQVKISRELNKPKHDNRVDGCGYFNCLGMVVDEKAKRAAEKQAAV